MAAVRAASPSRCCPIRHALAPQTCPPQRSPQTPVPPPVAHPSGAPANSLESCSCLMIATSFAIAAKRQLTDLGSIMRPKIEWPDGKKICATFTVAFEVFTRGGHFKKAKGLEVNLVSLSHANYGGNAGIWRILEVLERNGA